MKGETAWIFCALKPGAAEDPDGVKAISPQAAFLMNDVLAGNTDPRQNSWWSRTLALRNGQDGQRRGQGGAVLGWLTLPITSSFAWA